MDKFAFEKKLISLARLRYSAKDKGEPIDSKKHLDKRAKHASFSSAKDKGK